MVLHWKKSWINSLIIKKNLLILLRSLEGKSDKEIDSAIKKIMNREEYKDLPIGPLPALIDVRPQILIYNPDDERKPR